MPRTHEMLFIALLIFIIVLNLRDLYYDYADYKNGSYSLFNLALELFVITASTFGIAFLIHLIRQRMQELELLRQQLKTTHKNLSELNHDLNQMSDKMRQVSRQYNEVIQEQFTKWDLTPSEKEVAMLLLKGLSFEEIAGIRNAKEKTVRQQATAIYRKSGLNGRHEFAAWFFEDFLG
ncbi:MAG: helix-turn-helix transcriptional regulator [Thiothrix sp.]